MPSYRFWNGPNRGRWKAVAGDQFKGTSVADSSVSVLPANEARTYALFKNSDDTADIFLQLGAAATTTGLKLEPGAAYEMTMEAGNVWDGEVFALASVVGPITLVVKEIAENN